MLCRRSGGIVGSRASALIGTFRAGSCRLTILAGMTIVTARATLTALAALSIMTAMRALAGIGGASAAILRIVFSDRLGVTIG